MIYGGGNKMIHYNDSDYLMHYGVPGMKWGVRKDKYKAMSRSERKAARKSFKRKYAQDYTDAESKHSGNFDKGVSKSMKRLANKIETDDNFRATKEQEKKYNDYVKKSDKYIYDNTIKDMTKKYGSKAVKSMERRKTAQGAAIAASGLAFYGVIGYAAIKAIRK